MKKKQDINWLNYLIKYLNSDIVSVRTFALEFIKPNVSITMLSILKNTKDWEEQKLELQQKIVEKNKKAIVDNYDPDKSRRERLLSAKQLAIDILIEELVLARKQQLAKDGTGKSMMKYSKNISKIKDDIKIELGEATQITDSIWKAQQEKNNTDIIWSDEVTLNIIRPNQIKNDNAN